MEKCLNNEQQQKYISYIKHEYEYDDDDGCNEFHLSRKLKNKLTPFQTATKNRQQQQH